MAARRLLEALRASDLCAPESHSLRAGLVALLFSASIPDRSRGSEAGRVSRTACRSPLFPVWPQSRRRHTSSPIAPERRPASDSWCGWTAMAMSWAELDHRNRPVLHICPRPRLAPPGGATDSGRQHRCFARRRGTWCSDSFYHRSQPYIAPHWSPRGDRIAYDSLKDGAFQLFERPLDGGDRLLLNTPQSKQVTDWSRDGRYLLFRTTAITPADMDIWALPLGGESEPFPVVHGRRSWNATPSSRRTPTSLHTSRRIGPVRDLCEIVSQCRSARTNLEEWRCPGTVAGRWPRALLPHPGRGSDRCADSASARWTLGSRRSSRSAFPRQCRTGPGRCLAQLPRVAGWTVPDRYGDRTNSSPLRVISNWNGRESR